AGPSLSEQLANISPLLARSQCSTSVVRHCSSGLHSANSSPLLAMSQYFPGVVRHCSLSEQYWNCNFCECL
ncbi:hypothetical protein L195_g063916, partial [Trifolium pratense]